MDFVLLGITMFIMVAGTIALIVWIMYFDVVKRRTRIDDANKTQDIHSRAVLAAKSIGRFSYWRGSESANFLVFELPDGVRKDFCVDASVYNTMLEDEEGDLIYRELNGTCVFVSFQRAR